MTLGLHKKGSFYDIIHASGCRIVHPDFSLILDAIRDYCADHRISYYHKNSHEGVLRHLLVRRAESTGELLVALVTSSQYEQAEMEKHLADMSDILLGLSIQGEIAGFLHIINNSLGDVVKSDATHIIYGKDWFMENVLGLQFRITPFSFFQTNTKGAEVLYQRARDYVLAGGPQNAGNRGGETEEKEIFPGVKFSDFCGDMLKEVKKQYPYMITDNREDIVRISDYNRLMKLYGKKQYSLKEDEYLMVANFDGILPVRNEVLRQGDKLNIFGRSLKPKYKKCQEGFLDISSQKLNTGFIVVPDDVPKDKWIARDCLFGNYGTVTRQEARGLEKKIRSLPLKDSCIFTSKQELADASLGLSAMVTFIGLYLGIVFLLAGAAILALKELTESADNVERYRMLRKLGVEDHMLNGALFRQIFIFFLCPLILAVIHSYFGMRFAVDVLSYMADKSQLWISTLFAAGIITVIYGGYLIITYFSSKAIISE